MNLTARHWLIGVTATLLVVTTATFLAAQNKVVRVKEKVKGDFELYDFVSGGGSKSVYTVPSKRRLIVTDLFVSNQGSAAVMVGLQRGGSWILRNLAVGPQSTFEHAFGTGIRFSPGDSIAIFADTAATVPFNLRGYFVKD